MEPFLKEVGRGKRGARDLTREQAGEAMALIISGKATPAQTGAFFQAMRIKAETPEELAGMVEAAREFCVLAHRPPTPRRVELGLPYDGRSRAFHVMPFAAMLVRADGVQTFFHGHAGAGPKFGVNAIEILNAAGIEPSGDLSEADKRMNDKGVAFCGQEDYSPLLARLRLLRDEITLRGPLASVEKVLNLSGSSALLCGVTHTPYLATMAGALESLIEPWEASSAWVLQGSEGHVDFSGRRAMKGRVVKIGQEPADITLDGADADPWAKDGPSFDPPAPPEADLLDREDRLRWIDANLEWGTAALEGRTEQGRAALLASAAILLTASGARPDFASALKRAGKLLSEPDRASV